jgi:hypothetical protein
MKGDNVQIWPVPDNVEVRTIWVWETQLYRRDGWHVSAHDDISTRPCAIVRGCFFRKARREKWTAKEGGRGPSSASARSEKIADRRHDASERLP